MNARKIWIPSLVFSALLLTSDMISRGSAAQEAGFSQYFPLIFYNPGIEPGKIVFVSDRDGNNEIYTMNSNGSDVTRLTFNTYSDFAPDWSPDGSKIAFVSDRSGHYDLYVMDTDGSNQTLITTLTDCSSNCSSPKWSPDGTLIAFTYQLGHHIIISTMKLDGTPFGAGQADAFRPSWSPDGLRLAFMYINLSSSIYAIDVNGPSIPTLLVDLDGIVDMAWSPDGTHFALARYPDPSTTNPEIYIDDLVSSTTQRLTNTQSNHYSVDWSPTGDHLIFTSYTDDTNQEIYTMSAAGDQVTNISNHPAWDRDPDWTR